MNLQIQMRNILILLEYIKSGQNINNLEPTKVDLFILKFGSNTSIFIDIKLFIFKMREYTFKHL